ncbi:MAG: nucleoside triphosphate pyrophosphatase [Stagnimonas sp.]|nr:nucleoside triphosphate pyrophosphatase [Stagnimonas sp.]
MSSPAPLILASGSRYRAELLARLRLNFSQSSPDVDESPRPGEDGATLAQRLALAKAQAVGTRAPQSWVIGSDQVAVCEERLIGKPGTREAAIEQLRWMSGRVVHFLTAVVLLRESSGTVHPALDRTLVRFRALGPEEIERYVDAEPSFDCAGSAKIEGLGISLCEEVQSRDPTALIGLPLIATAQLLRLAGFALP